MPGEKLQSLLLKTIPKATKNPPKTTENRSPLKLAIALLLQHPELFCELDKTTIEIINTLEEPILKELISIIIENPKITTAQLVERWRNSKEFQKLSVLATWDHGVPQQALFKEWHDVLVLLQKQQHNAKIKALMLKLNQQTLNDDERLALQALLHKKHN